MQARCCKPLEFNDLRRCERWDIECFKYFLLVSFVAGILSTCIRHNKRCGGSTAIKARLAIKPFFLHSKCDIDVVVTDDNWLLLEAFLQRHTRFGRDLIDISVACALAGIDSIRVQRVHSFRTGARCFEIYCIVLLKQVGRIGSTEGCTSDRDKYRLKKYISIYLQS